MKIIPSMYENQPLQMTANPLTWIKWWITPRATDRSIAFRERVMRVIVGILFALSGFYTFVFTIVPQGAREGRVLGSAIILLITLTVLAIVVALLQSHRYNPASWVLVSLMAMGSLSAIIGRGNWGNTTALLLMLTIVVGQVILRRHELLFLYAVVVAIIFASSSLNSDYVALLIDFVTDNDSFPPAARIQLATGANVFNLLFFNLVVMVILHAQRREADHRLSELQAANEDLENRVVARTSELQLAKEEAERANRVKSQFLASMSHELRTPLNAILNFTRFNLMGIYGDLTDRQRDSMQKTLHSGEYLLELINDVLDIAKIEADSLQMFIQDNVNLNEEMTSVASSAESLLGDKKEQVKLIIDADANLPQMVGDQRRIRQICLNLVSNACKFTNTGSVTISAKRYSDNDVQIAVLDTGPGIPSEKIDIIFEPFKQTETGIQHQGGTGLGLAITKRLVEAHHGTIHVETEVGEGAAFYVTLPIQSPKLLER